MSGDPVPVRQPVPHRRFSSDPSDRNVHPGNNAELWCGAIAWPIGSDQCGGHRNVGDSDLQVMRLESVFYKIRRASPAENIVP